MRTFESVDTEHNLEYMESSTVWAVRHRDPNACILGVVSANASARSKENIVGPR